jgi:ribosomal protein S12 methylthiotransferase RimO
MADLQHTVHVVRLGCARNDVDAEELAGRLAAGGFQVVEDPTAADTILVNTCGFIDAAKKDSIDQLLAAAELKRDGVVRNVVAVGCLAERYGSELAAELPEADAVLGFDDYPEIAERLRWIAAGGRVEAHQPQDRRELLPIAPMRRHDLETASPAAVLDSGRPNYLPRLRLDSGPTAALKIASGCDRRCAFCVIPSFRGAYLSKTPAQVCAEAAWLVGQGAKELLLVSENTTSYGKDLAAVNPAQLLAELSIVPGVEWIRMTYLQPAELRPALVSAIGGTDHVVPYFDVPFQHASPSVLRRMRRFGDPESFLGLLEQIRQANPAAGIRSNVIVGFPQESDADLEILAEFLAAARLDAIGVFGFSNEEGTEAYGMDGQLSDTEIAGRVEWLTSLTDELMADRADERIGERVEVLITEVGEAVGGRAAHQGPDDGMTWISGTRPNTCVGDIILGVVKATDGVDLIAEVMGE